MAQDKLHISRVPISFKIAHSMVFIVLELEKDVDFLDLYRV